MSEGQQQGRPDGSVAQYYDGAAETWDQTHGAGRQNAYFAAQLRAELRRLLGGARPGATALEIGAGTGPYVDVTASLFHQLVAVDVSEGMLAVFARRIEALKIKNVVLLLDDAYALSKVADGSIDTVYSIGLLETIADLERMFRAIHRVLKPGGIVAGITSNGACPWYTLRRWVQGGERHARTDSMPTAETIARSLDRVGFAAPEFACWGVVPPGMQSRAFAALLRAAEPVLVKTPASGFLGVLSFRARKLGRLAESN